jgi:hypothetical protein
LPKVRILFDSIEQHHPEWHRQLVLAERSIEPGDLELANAHSAQSLSDLEIPDWEPWSFCHRLVELATAIKPFALKQLLTKGESDRVIYLDPDTAVFSRLDDVLQGLEESSILLSPHQLTPESTLGRVIDNEISSLNRGIYNLGFLGVAGDPVGEAFAEWWSQRLYFFCRDDLPNGLFTDQKWADLIPALFPAVAVMRSSRLNVASWNLSERKFSEAEGAYLVDGSPLGFYHFTSVSSDSHELMMAKNSDSPPAVRRLLAWYRERERSLGQHARPDWSFATYSDGTPIEDQHRAAFRDSRALQLKYGNPYDAGGLLSEIMERPTLLESENPAEWMNRRVSPGYAVHQGLFDRGQVLRLLRAAFSDPASMAKISKKAINVLSREGIRGVVRRLR